MKKISLLILWALAINHAQSQKVKFEYEKAPLNSGFQMEGYWVWCGSMIKVDSVYHLFASRWPKTGPFPEGYRTNSEIVRATAASPYGPFVFREVVIGERDSMYWDSNMAHNPFICKIDTEYVLFYNASDFVTINKNNGALLRRIGFAKANKITGPWFRSETPLIATESNNPAVLIDQKQRIKLLYRDEALRAYLVEAVEYDSIYTMVNDNVWPGSRLEDFYLFKTKNTWHFICEDNEGRISGHERWGIHFFSPDGRKNWQRYKPVIAYNHDIEFINDSVLHCVRRERPQLFIENNMATWLLTAVYDGKNSWCQPVKLKYPIKMSR